MDKFNDRYISELNTGIIILDKSLRIVHQPDSQEALQSAYYRLKFDEYFFLQLVLAINKYQLSQHKGKKFIELGDYAVKMYKSLNFTLTNAQIKVMREIRKDLAMDKPMNRLIQGDVGCGKTVIAMLTSAIIVGNGAQVAIMAPTEILAEQHYDSFIHYCKDLDVSCELLIGNTSTKDKKQLYENLKNGKTQIVVGTHALIQEKVIFKNLELVVVDEQHRFGVEQRKKLITKGQHVNILAMTATPIPRTLTFAIHGDMDLSWIDELPKDRLPIRTSVIDYKKIDVVYSKMKNEMDKGRFCFIVFPIIEESDKIDAEAAESAYNNFKDNIFSNYTVGFLHGKLNKESKTNIMNQVNNGEIQCLVSTTVVEVGIDTPFFKPLDVLPVDISVVFFDVALSGVIFFESDAPPPGGVDGVRDPPPGGVRCLDLGRGVRRDLLGFDELRPPPLNISRGPSSLANYNCLKPTLKTTHHKASLVNAKGYRSHQFVIPVVLMSHRLAWDCPTITGGVQV